METATSPSTSMLCWGSMVHGQLGLGGIEEEQISLPRELPVFRGRQVTCLGCGPQHTLFILRDGTVYSCGNNDWGQLGHNKTRKRPGTLILQSTLYILHCSPLLYSNMAMMLHGPQNELEAICFHMQYSKHQQGQHKPHWEKVSLDCIVQSLDQCFVINYNICIIIGLKYTYWL